jgi:flagellar motor switch protein FliM
MSALRDELGKPLTTRTADGVGLAEAERNLRFKMPAIGRPLASYAEQARGILCRYLGVPVPMSAGRPQTIAPTAVRGLLSDLPMLSELHLDGGGLAGFIGMDGGLCFRLVERAFGAPAVSDQFETIERTKLTNVENRIVLPVLKELCAELASTLLPEQPRTLKLQQLPPRMSVEVPPQVECALLWQLLLDNGHDTEGGLHVLLLPGLVDVAMPGVATDAQEPHAWMASHISRASVEVHAALGTVEMTLSDLLGLKPGDVLRLDRYHSENILVHVQSRPKFIGRPTQQNGAFGVEISGELP